MQLPAPERSVGVPDATQACRTGLELGYAARLASSCRRPHDMQAPGAWQGSGITLRDPNRWDPRPPTITVTQSRPGYVWING
jgi:hypothetical protein